MRKLNDWDGYFVNFRNIQFQSNSNSFASKIIFNSQIDEIIANSQMKFN